MARLPRIHLEGALYVVTSRGGTSAPVFKDQADFEAYLGLVADYKSRYGFKLFAYCLLPDGVSLCLEPAPGTTSSSIMHDLTSRYTKYFNKRYERTGPLFHERFKAVVIEKQPYLLPITAYLHRHPMDCGVTREVRDYPFSSYPLYCCAEGGTSRLAMQSEILEVLAHLPDGAATGAAYERYVNQVDEREMEVLREGFQKPILGSVEFVEAIQAKRARRVSRLLSSATPQATVMARRRPYRALAMAGGLVVVGLTVAALWQRIGFLEQAVLALSQENDAAFRARYSLAVDGGLFNPQLGSLSGTTWEIRMMPVGAEGTDVVQQDQLAFTHHQVSSRVLAAQGFPTSNYTLTRQPNGSPLWGTMQTDPQGEVVCWRGEIDGTTMRGIVTRQPVGQAAQNFTFVGVSRQTTDATRSEI